MIDRFQFEAEAVGAIVKRCSSVTTAVAYVQTLGNDGGMLTTHLPAEIEQSLPSNSIPVDKDAAGASLCLSFAKAGIAATGSLLLDITDQKERSYTALTPVHAVFIRASSIVPDIYALHEVISRDITSGKAAYLSLTTGPSRTADIERVLTIGVHGAKELHVLVLEGE